METNPTRMCERLVGLPEVDVLGLHGRKGQPLEVHIATRRARPGCPTCGVLARVKDRHVVELVDLPCFGRPTRLMWNKIRWHCPDPDCSTKSWTEEDPRIAAPRMAMTDRAGRWSTEQVGRYARTVNEIATQLGCDWHTVNDVVIRYGEALVDEPGRYSTVSALGLDEVLFLREGPQHHLKFTTTISDVKRHQLIDIVPGRAGKKPSEWIENKGEDWRKKVRWCTLDLSNTYRSVFNKMLPNATQVADPFHVVKHANEKLDECRRRVQNEVLGHRGMTGDPLYRCRRLLTKADERLDDNGREKLLGLLQAGDPKGEVTTAWHAKEAIRDIYAHTDQKLAGEWIDQLIVDLADEDNPVEVRSLSKTLKKWKEHIIAWHRSHATNGPAESMNNLVKRVKRAAYGFTSFRNYRVRSLLYAGKPRWHLLATITPR